MDALTDTISFNLEEKGEAIDAYLKELENLYIQLGRLQEKLHRLKNPNDGKPWSIDDDL